MGAIDFQGTTDLMEAERWLRETERIFLHMQYSPKEKLDYVVSLLRGDAYDWWEIVPNSMIRPWVLTYNDFLLAFREKYVPEEYQHDKL